MQNNETTTTSNGCCALLSDEKLVEMAVSNDAKALEEIVARYKNLVRARARSFFLVGADNDDVIQEGMIGLFKAIRDFKQSKQSSFSSFAQLCVTRQILSAIKSATRNKHMPLNTYISLNRSVNDDAEHSLLEIVSEGSTSDPEAMLLLKEQITTLNKRIRNELSPFEQSVFSLYLDGHSYNEISFELKTHTKSVDNALQRIKRKLGKNSNTA